MSYPRILSTLRSARWAITPSALNGIVDTLGAHLRGDFTRRQVMERRRAAGMFDDDDELAAADSTPDTYELAAPGVARIRVNGIIGKHLSMLETMCGGVDVDTLGSLIDQAAADDTIAAVILDIDSPGGVVTGVPELVAKIRALGKPTVAFTDTMAASAGYWLAASCDYIAATPTADLGSIGVYVALLDDSAWYAKEGYKLELIKAGDYKGMGMSGASLTDAERALIQEEVDAIYGMFTADVRAGRSTVTDATMQGQTFMGSRAADAGLVDEIVPDFKTLLTSVTALLG